MPPKTKEKTPTGAAKIDVAGDFLSIAYNMCSIKVRRTGMQKNYSIHYKLNGVDSVESAISGNADTHPITEFSALQILTAKHGGLNKGEPTRVDIHEEIRDLGITDVRVIENQTSTTP